MASNLDIRALRDTYSLEPCGNSINTDYYALDEGLLIAIPHDGSKDTGDTALSNREEQAKYFRERGQRGGIVIFFDRMTSQDKDARRVYERMDDVLTATALVGGTMLTRAMVSFFLGLAKTRVPIKLFADIGPALVWLRERNATSDRALGYPDQ